MEPKRPSKADLAAVIGTKLPDVLGPQLEVVFCGINPGLYSAAVGHHFARPGNRFWAALQASGFTSRLFAPCEDQDLLDLGLGLTNIVDRATARADELSHEELVMGRLLLAEKVRKHSPRWVAILGITAYRVAFERSKAVLGEQRETIDAATVWVLPNPSGLNAHHQPKLLAEAFARLRNRLPPNRAAQATA